MSDPKLIIKTLLDNSLLKSGLSDMNSMVSGASAKVGTFAKVGAAAVGTAVAAGTTAAATLVKKSVEGYATFEQMVGGVETLFGAGGQSMEEYAQSTGKTVGEIESKYNSLMTAQTTVLNNANNAYKTAGLSANGYMETVTSFSARDDNYKYGYTVTDNFYAIRGSVSSAAKNTAFWEDVWTIKQNGANTTFGSNSVTLDNAGNFALTSPFYIGCMSKNGKAAGAGLKGKIYYSKIYSGSNLVADMIPVKKSDGTLCLYDKVRKKYIYKSGNGTVTE